MQLQIQNWTIKHLEVFGRSLIGQRTKQAGLSPVDGTWRPWGWWPFVQETETGGWQRNLDVPAATILRHPTVYACLTLIQEDIGKMRLKLMQDIGGVLTEFDNPAYSPVLRKPNHFQTRQQWLESWINSKLVHGNTYQLKQRDARQIVTALYTLDPSRLKVLVAPDGSVFYELFAQEIPAIRKNVTVPAREIIHDRISPLFHPLVGVSPLYAAATLALYGLNIEDTASTFFANGGRVAGILTSDQFISQETAARAKAYWQTEYGSDGDPGKVAVLGEGLKYQPLGIMSASDSQLIEQANWIDEKICSVFHVPPHKVGVGDQPNYNNIEALNQQYWSECLQKFAVAIQTLLIEGLDMRPYVVQFDLNDLLRMDTATKVKAAADGIKAGFLAPNEARAMFFDLPPVEGGDTPYLQQQDFSLAALARRDSQDPPPQPTPAAPPDDGEKSWTFAEQHEALSVFRKEWQDAA